MKMIDFTPLVTMGYKKVLTRLAIASFAVALAVKIYVSAETPCIHQKHGISTLTSQ